ncbi:MAG: phosphatidylserine decarboxylase, partial [Gloeobacteraceae cyanobacterium ES-bin-316]|nr:phosphatidylserine decarboxylase [Ferruginibacter sp.]
MTIHREGTKSIAIATMLFCVLNVVMFWIFGSSLLWLCIIFLSVTLAFVLFVVSFFRIPSRTLTIHDGQIICPADGKVVVIEETVDVEYFKDKRLQVSVFMSPANVHVNRNPISGEV